MQKTIWTANDKYYHDLISDNISKYKFNIFKYYIMIVLVSCMLVGVTLILDFRKHTFLISLLLLPISVPLATVITFFVYIDMYIAVTIIFLLTFLIVKQRKNKEIKKKIAEKSADIKKEAFYNIEIEFANDSLKIHIMGDDYNIPYLDVLHFIRKNKYILIRFKNHSVLKIPKTAFNPKQDYINYLNDLTEKKTIKHIQSRRNMNLEHILKTIDYKYKTWFDIMLTLIISVIFSTTMFCGSNAEYAFVLPIYVTCIILTHSIVKKKCMKKWKEKICPLHNVSGTPSNGENISKEC